MKGSVLLSGEDLKLARGELSAVLKSLGEEMEPEEEDGRLVIFEREVPKGTMKRMGMGHFSSLEIGVSGRSLKDITGLVESILDTAEKDERVSVKVISPGQEGHLRRKELFELFCHLALRRGLTLKHRDPDRRFYLFVGTSIHAGRILEEADRGSVRSRRGSRLPFSRPIIMDPRLARVLINLSTLPPGSLILDPFMGAASLALEATHLGHHVIGVERDPDILAGALTNISAQGMSHMIETHRGDSRKLGGEKWWRELDHVDGIVTDPPFGKSAPLMGEEPSTLLRDVIRVAADKLPHGGPLVLDTDRKENLQFLEGFDLTAEYDFRVHKSLTRTIGVLRKIT
ncbi:MAG TPA: hypothetical protein ENK47_07435 [Euryarchaeota archaeon]|nr:hypothetical protein [Euryarchaeota archaeon]